MSPTAPYPSGHGGPAHPPPAPVPAGPEDDGDPARRARALSWSGVRTVMVLELRQRVRSTKWKVALGAYAGVVALITLLLLAVLRNPGVDEGRVIYELILLFVLGLGLLVTPTLASTAINGDRVAGTLAIMQVTKLSPADLALGKLAAGWAAALAFLVVSLPFLFGTWLLSGFGVVAFLRGMAVLALLLGVVCAVSLGFSALTTRPAGSSVLSYLTVGTLTVITLILFALTIPLVTVERDVRIYAVPSNSDQTCQWETQRRDVIHTDRTWWLLVINPFVVLADAASPDVGEPDALAGPLDAIRGGVQAARAGPETDRDQCWSGNYGPDAPERAEYTQGAFWPAGLGLNLLLGAGGLALAIRRLAVPYRRLPPGSRVA